MVQPCMEPGKLENRPYKVHRWYGLWSQENLSVFLHILAEVAFEGASADHATVWLIVPANKHMDQKGQPDV